MVPFFSQLPPCLIGMEACGGAHHWARQLMAMGHAVRLMAPQFVKPYVKTNKNDAADAEAICEAVGRPCMRFVPIKSLEQQALIGLHRARAGFVAARTAQSNQIRGLLNELGWVLPAGIAAITGQLPERLAQSGHELCTASRALFARLLEHFRELDRQVREIEREITAWHREDDASQRLQHIPGIGPLTASALVASVGNARDFRNARQFAAWLGLVPRQNSSGGRTTLLGISKRGDTWELSWRLSWAHRSAARIRPRWCWRKKDPTKAPCRVISDRARLTRNHVTQRLTVPLPKSTRFYAESVSIQRMPLPERSTK
jgi:transposase